MYHRIMVPLDGSATAERGLREAIGLAVEHKARLYLLHVVDDFPTLLEISSVASYQEMLNGLRQYGEGVLAKARRAAEDAGVQAESLLREVRHQRIAEVIVEEARKASCDLIVTGTHGRRGFSRLTMGSEAELLVRISPLPVLLVRLEETRS
jgi:nucleotide-binding universal stress UspA family protein